jgi:flagellar biosynthetic protein FliP
MIAGCAGQPGNAFAARAARRARRMATCGALTISLLALGVAPARAQEPAADNNAAAQPTTTIQLPQVHELVSRDSLSNSMQIVVLLTLLTVLPSILLMMTSFVRVLVVLVLLRQALGTQQLPPSQVLIGLALFLTILVMAPTWERVNNEAVQPYLNEEIGQLDALGTAGGELRNFMFRQIIASGNQQDVYLMYEYAAQRSVPEEEVLDQRDVPMTALIPAFILSELKTAFVIGFRIYLPFLVIDMVIATVLVSMGMMMLPPILISLPFKLLLFVLADGWHLIVGSLMSSISL